MYYNMLAEMIRRNINTKDIAKYLGISPSSMSAKMNNRDTMRLTDAQRIKDAFFPDLDFNYLFEYRDEP